MPLAQNNFCASVILWILLTESERLPDFLGFACSSLLEEIKVLSFYILNVK